MINTEKLNKFPINFQFAFSEIPFACNRYGLIIELEKFCEEIFRQRSFKFDQVFFRPICVEFLQQKISKEDSNKNFS